MRIATAEASIAAQAAVEAYVAAHPAYDGSIGVLVNSALYSASYGVVVEHEAFPDPEAVRAARRAVEAQGLRLDTERWSYAWDITNHEQETTCD